MASNFTFPPVDTADERGRVIAGGDLQPETLLTAYRSGLFPMRDGSGALTWWCPDPRGILSVGGLRVSKSLRRSRRDFAITVDSRFEAVLDRCADRGPDDYLWITDDIGQAYLRLHRLGWAHSVEAWTVPTGGKRPELVGGLYGVAIGGLFAGESMFHRQPDASKVALMALVELLGADSGGCDRFIDVQWLTPHLATLGAVAIPRQEYLSRLQQALTLPLPKAFSRPCAAS